MKESFKGFDTKKMKDWFDKQGKKGPDPFFTDWQKSSKSSPDQEYYRDLVKKIFMVTGAFILLRLLTSSGGQGGRSMNP